MLVTLLHTRLHRLSSTAEYGVYTLMRASLFACLAFKPLHILWPPRVTLE